MILMARGVTAFRAVFWATVLAVAASFLRREHGACGRAGSRRALAAGARGVLPVVATTATAGIIVGVVTLTGLGLKVAGVIVTLAAGQLVLTALYAALAVWVLGLAVPVTASYIIAAVMIAPALTQRRHRAGCARTCSSSITPCCRRSARRPRCRRSRRRPSPAATRFGRR